MHYNLEKFSQYYHETSDFLRGFQLPLWEDFPDIALYMDQLIILINRYLPFQDNERTVTASMINNYVKLKLMPRPYKKKYDRSHLAYLVVICSLKDALGMAVIQRIFPPNMEGEQLKERYNAFVRNQVKAYHFVADQADSVAIPLLQEERPDRIHDLVMQTAVSASVAKNLAERFSAQQTPDPPKKDS